jgi:hypothetical protein
MMVIRNSQAALGGTPDKTAVRMAVATLRDEGRVVTIGGRGTFVSPKGK